MKKENHATQLWAGSGKSDARNTSIFNNGPTKIYKKLIALLTAFVFTWSMCITPVMAEKIDVQGGSIDVDVKDNTTNWNVTGNPVWNVPEFNVPQGNIYNIAGLNQGASLALLVNGGQASNIFGTMNLSNLDFILQNIAGINIGASGMINLNNASLIASTLPLNTNVTDFLARQYEFSGQGGFLTNDGKIVGNNADLVALVANAIENKGTIEVPMGTVALAAGDTVTVGISGDGLVSIGVDPATANNLGLSSQIKNTGTISADGGKVILNAQAMDGLFDKAISIERSGNSVDAIKAENGTIEFQSMDDIYNEAVISASGGIAKIVSTQGSVTNAGRVEANKGKVEIVAAKDVTNKAAVQADEGSIIVVSTKRDVINQGTMKADKGKVEVVAEKAVTNKATLQADEGSIKATSIKNDVVNQGTMRADKGEVKIVSTQGAITNEGTVKADHGTIQLTAEQAAYNKAILEALYGRIEVTSQKAEVTNAGTMDATGGKIEVRAAGAVETSGVLKAQEVIERGASFKMGGRIEIGAMDMDNLDNRADISGGAELSGTFSDEDDITVLGNFSLIGDTTIWTDSNVTGDDGTLTWSSSYLLTGNGYDLTLKVSKNSTVGAISGVNLLTFDKNTGKTPTYTGSTSDDISVNTIKTEYGAIFSKDVTVGSDHMIYSASDAPGGLQYMDQNLGYNYKMANNIDASETASWNSGAGFNPVGYDDFNYYSGTFNGNSKTITGLTINRPSDDHVGLFGNSQGYIQNLGLEDLDITGNQYTGGLAGRVMWGYAIKVSNVYSTGSIQGGDSTGGLVGHLYDARISDSYSTADVSGGAAVGGLAGAVVYSQVFKSYATGTVTGDENVGGLAGWCYSGASGGPQFVMQNSFFAGEVVSNGENVGGLIAYIGQGEYALVSDSYYTDSHQNTWGTYESSGASAFMASTHNVYDTGSYLWDIASTNDGSVWAMQANGGMFPMLQMRYSTSITDAYQLQLMFLNYSANYTLKNDIDASDTANWNWDGTKYLGFTPIGVSHPVAYLGTFEGAGHVISDLYINRPASTTGSVGLFGDTRGAIIRNVGIVDANITGSGAVGALVGGSNWNYGLPGTTVSNSYSSGSITGTGNYVGGLVGYNVNYSTVNDSYSTANVTSTKTGAVYVGGLVGLNGSNVSINRSYATGNVTGTTDNYAGGLSGANQGNSSIVNSFSTGAVSGTAGRTGGLTGQNASSTITNSHFTDSANDNSLGSLTTASALTSSGHAVYSGWDFDVDGVSAGHNGVWIMAGLPHLQNEWTTTITNAAQLQMMALDLDANYTLANNIDASNTVNWNAGLGFDPVGYSTNSAYSSPNYGFMGTFNGASHTITGLTINRPTEDYVGLFGATLNANIHDVGVVNGNVSGRGQTGLLSGFTMGTTITNSYTTGLVSGGGAGVGSGLGGLVGWFLSGTNIIGSHSDADVVSTGSSYVGGLVGHTAFSGTIQNSYATGDVTALSANPVGGLAGHINGVSITNSYATGNVRGMNGVGGLVGSTNSGSITNSYATGSVTGTDSIGGLVGGTGNQYGTTTITNTYAAGAVSGTTNKGGLIGSNTGATLSHNYWDTQTTGQSSSAGQGANAVEGKTTAQMMNSSTFSGWDIADHGGHAWMMAGNPHLQIENTTTITNAAQLQLMAVDLTKNYTLANDIDASATSSWNAGSGFDPIGGSPSSSDPEPLSPYSGTFDGQGHTITGLNITRHTGSAASTDLNSTWVGLFGAASGIVKNVGMLGVNIWGNLFVGGLVGELTPTGTVMNSYTTGTMRSTYDQVGGLVGQSHGTITNTYSTASIRGDYWWAGGLVGVQAAGTLSNSYASGNVSLAGGGAGGLVGNSGGTISHSFATGTVSGGSAGGLVSGYGSPTIDHSYFTGPNNGRGTYEPGGTAAFNGSSHAVYSGWNFTNSWQANAGALPTLRSASDPLSYTIAGLISGLGAGISVALSLNGAAPVTTTTTSGGAFSFGDLTLSGSEYLLIYANDGSYAANLVGKVQSAGNISGLQLQDGRFAIGDADGVAGTSFTNADLASAYYNNSNVHYSVSGSDVTFLNGIDLWVPANVTYTPGGNITATGSWINQGVFNAGNFSVDLLGNGSHTILSNGSHFNDLTVQSGNYGLQDALHVDGDITIVDGFTGGPAGYDFRKTVTIDHTKVAGDLSGFPVLFSVTDPALIGKVKSGSNYTIKFTNALGTELPYEVESYNDTTGALTVWVKLDSISSSADTSFHIYYGTEATAATDNPTAVWDANYMGVWHMNTSGSTLLDSKGTYNGSIIGTPDVATGAVGGALTFIGNQEYVNVPNTVSTDGSYTVQCWVSLPSAPSSYMEPVRKGNYVSYRLNIYADGDVDTVYAGPGGNYYVAETTGGGYSLGSWQQMTGVYDAAGQTIKIYLNGQLQATGAAPNAPAHWDDNQPMNIGSWYGTRVWTYEPFVGTIDEVRFSNTNRSDTWITTEFNNQSAPSSFLNAGSQVGSGAILNANGFDVEVKGNWTSAADNFVSGASLVTFNGDVLQTVTAPSTNFDRVTVANTSAGGVQLASDLNVADTLTVNSGSVMNVAGYGITAGENVVNSGTITSAGADLNIAAKAIAFTGILSTTTSGNINLDSTVSTPGVFDLGAINSAGAINIGGTHAPSSVILNDDITAKGDASFHAPVVLGADVSIDTSAGNGNVTFGSSIASDAYDTPRNLTLTTGDGDISFEGAVGGGGSEYGDASAYWSFDDGTAVDGTGHGYNGTIYGDTSLTTGKVGGGLYFDGSGDYIDMGYSLNVPTWTDYTVSVWFLNNGGGDHSNGYGQKIISKTDWYQDWDLRVYPNEGQLAFATYNPGAGGHGLSAGAVNYADNAWHHVIITKQGSSGEMWVDGALKSSDVLVTSSNGTPLLIGYSMSGDSYQQKYWSGNIDEVAVWSKALTPDQIATIYNNGQGYAPGVAALGAITINSAKNVMVSSTMNAASMTQVAGTGTTAFDGTVDLSGAMNITNNVIQLKDVTTGGAQTYSGTVTISGNLTAGNAISVNGAATLATDATLTSVGNISFSSTINSDSTARSLALDAGSANVDLQDAVGGVQSLSSLTANGNVINLSDVTTAGVQTYNGAAVLNGDLAAGGELTVNGSLNAQGHTISEGGSWDFAPITNVGVVSLTGSGKTITSGAKQFGNLTISGAYSLVDALTATGELSVTGTLDAASKAISEGGNWAFTGLSNLGDITLTGSEKTITSGANQFNNLTISGAYTLVDALTATGELSVTGTLDAASKAISEGGNWAFTGLSNLANITLTGSGKTLTSGSSQFGNLAISGAYSLVDALHVNGGLNVTGTLDSASKAMTLAGDLDLTKISNAGNVTLDGTGTLTSAGKSINDLLISGAYMLADALQVNGALSIPGTLNAASKAMTLAQSLDLTKILNARDVTLTGSGTLTAAGKSVNDLTVSGTYSFSDAVTVSGDLNLTGGSITQNGNLAITGGYIQTGGTFTDSNPLVHTFTVAGSFSVPYGNGAFKRYTGAGSANDPYVIRSVYDLQAMKSNLASNFKLNDAMDAASAAAWNSGAGFDPIGNGSNAFTGALDGNGKVISNLQMHRTESDYLGLFGNIGSSGSVSQLGLEDVSIYGRDHVGGLAGLNAGSLTNVYTTGPHTVSGVNFVGGLVGDNKGNIANAYSAARVTGSADVGGLAGTNTGTINKAYAMGYVEGSTNKGGLVGSGAGTVTNSFWDKKMTGQTTSAGGTAGKAVLMVADAQGYEIEDPDTISDTTSPDMMSMATYTSSADPNSKWDFDSTWVMDEGGTYPHFQYRYENGVRGVGGHVYMITNDNGTSTTSAAGAGQDVALYYSATENGAETNLNYTVGTGASSRYYGVLDKSVVGETAFVIGKSLNGTSKMEAKSGSIYPLDIWGSQSHTLVRPNVPTNVVITIPAEPAAEEAVSRTLVDVEIIPINIPSVDTTLPTVTIVDQTGMGSADFSTDFSNFMDSLPSAPVTEPLVVVPHSVTPPPSEEQDAVVQSEVAEDDSFGTEEEMDISFEEESPAGREPVPVAEEQNSSETSEVKTSGNDESAENGTVTEEGGASSKDDGKSANWRDVPIIGFTGVEDAKKFLTDVRVIEGAVYVIDGANAMSLLGMGDSLRVFYKRKKVATSKRQTAAEANVLKSQISNLQSSASAEPAVKQALEEVLKKAGKESSQVLAEPEATPAPEARVLKSAIPIVMGETKSGDRYGTLKNPGKDVFVKNPGGEWKAAKDGMVILPGDEVKTAPQNSVNVLMDGGATGRIEIKEGSLFRIQKAVTDATTGDKSTILELAIGKILVKVESIKGNGKFEVRTPTALTGVRGTVFEVTVKEKV
jgi:hypothetical protein